MFAILKGSELLPGSEQMLDTRGSASFGGAPNFLIRDLQDGDSIEALTDLLHRAYKRLLDLGLRYWATHQTVDDTRARIAGGRCLVAVLNGRIVGTELTENRVPHPAVGAGPTASQNSARTVWALPLFSASSA